MNKIKDILLIILTILVLFFGFSYYFNSQKLTENKSLLSSLNSKLELSKNKLGQEVAKREIIETYNTKMFTRMELQDSTLKDLQKLVKDNRKLIKNSGSATILEGETIIDNSTITNIYQDKDSNVVYKSAFKNEWIDYTIMAKKDTTSLNLKFTNKYDIVLGYEKQGFFKKKKAYANVTNHNPYTKTKELRTYQVKQKPQRFTIGLQVGYGITTDGLRGYIGVGGGLTLIKF